MEDKGRPCDITRVANDLNTRASELKKMTTTVGQYRPPTVTFIPSNMDTVATMLDGLNKKILGEVLIHQPLTGQSAILSLNN